jgi:iron complex transport system substrate-binding protein
MHRDRRHVDDTNRASQLINTFSGAFALLSHSLKWMRLAALVAGLIGALPWQAGADEPPARIVSLNLCADQFVLALAERGRIASLSPSAADAGFSFLAKAAEGLPRNRGDGEAFALAPPDLVLLGPWDRRAHRGLLVRAGLRLHVVEFWRDLADGETQIRAAGRALGAPDKAEAIIAAIAAGRAKLRALLLPPKRFLILQRRGYVPGPANVVSEALREAGLVDAAAGWGLPFGGLASLERILAEAPDFLVITEEDLRGEDVGSAFIEHPALAARYPASRRLILPRRLTLCDGPATPTLFDRLADEVRRLIP